MIGYLRGEILNSQDGKFLVLTQNSIGYEIQVPTQPHYGMKRAKEHVELFIYTHVREDALDLYGFFTTLEKQIFLTLLSVNGIGPKVAMGILSSAHPETLVSSILNEDKSALTDLPGIGKKTAERLILELRDPLRKKIDAGEIPLPVMQPVAKTSGTAVAIKTTFRDPLFEDARAALVSLGYKESEAVHLLEKASERVEHAKKAEDLIRIALQSTAVL